MNKYFVILSVIILAGVSMANGVPPDPRMDAGMLRVYCSIQPIPPLAGNQSAFNATYNAPMSAAIGDVGATMISLFNDCNTTKDFASFSSLYSTLPQKLALVTSIYFQAGFTAVKSGSTSWPYVMSQYMTSMSLVQPCMQILIVHNCAITGPG